MALVKKGCTDSEIAKFYGVSRITISRRKRKFGVCNNSIRLELLPNNLTDLQSEIVCGLLLGDGSIGRKKTLGSNCRFGFGQKHKNKEYVEHIYNILLPFSRPVYPTVRILRNKKHKGFQFSTTSHPIFTYLQSKWYTGKQKIVPSDLKLTWQTVAYWYMDDGCNHQKHRKKTITLATDCFTKK